MKPSFDLSRVAILGSTLAFSLFLTACGQKGPLFMPKIPPLATQPSGTSAPLATPATVTAPGTTESGAAKAGPHTQMVPPEPTGPDTISQ
ncbi:LPS translocon maturation chaperone LptM [Glaciimonas sp. GNP009]